MLTMAYMIGILMIYLFYYAQSIGLGLSRLILSSNVACYIIVSPRSASVSSSHGIINPCSSSTSVFFLFWLADCKRNNWRCFSNNDWCFSWNTSSLTISESCRGFSTPMLYLLLSKFNGCYKFKKKVEQLEGNPYEQIIGLGSFHIKNVLGIRN